MSFKTFQEWEDSFPKWMNANIDASEIEKKENAMNNEKKSL